MAWLLDLVFGIEVGIHASRIDLIPISVLVLAVEELGIDMFVVDGGPTTALTGSSLHP